MKRLLTLACLLTATVARAQLPLADAINGILADPKVTAAHWGISVMAMDGTPIYALNDGQLFEPASNAKLFTTAAALALFKPEQNFATKVIARGTLGSEGTLDGDLILYGAGDANISGRVLPYTNKTETLPDAFQAFDAMAAQITQTGLKTVHGEIVGDDTLFPHQPYGDGWVKDDLPWGYGAPVSALTVTDNQLKLTITPAKVAGGAATLSLAPAMPAYYTLHTAVTTGTAKTQTLIQIERVHGADTPTLRIYGSIAVNGAADVENIAIDDPAQYGAMALQQALEAHGITVTGHATAKHRPDEDYRSLREESHQTLPGLSFEQHLYGSEAATTPEQRVLAQHLSPMLMDDVTVTNKVSQNLHAELLLRQLGLHFGTAGSFAQGARVVRQFAIQAGVQANDFYFVDGSGLSTYDLVAPRAFTTLLRFAATQPWGASYKASLPIGGVDGSLEGRFTKAPLKGKVFAKTGTLSEDRALSGYVVCASGRTVVFSILVGNHMPGNNADRDAMDRIVAAIAAAN